MDGTDRKLTKDINLALKNYKQDDINYLINKMNWKVEWESSITKETLQSLVKEEMGKNDTLTRPQALKKIFDTILHVYLVMKANKITIKPVWTYTDNHLQKLIGTYTHIRHNLTLNKIKNILYAENLINGILSWTISHENTKEILKDPEIKKIFKKYLNKNKEELKNLYQKTKENKKQKPIWTKSTMEKESIPK